MSGGSADYNRYGASSVVLCGMGPKAPVETVIGGQGGREFWVLGIARIQYPSVLREASMVGRA